MGKKEENAGFTCIVCQRSVKPLQNGCYRNHCPFCLSSLHVDDIPGDRKSFCQGVMKPIGLKFNGKKGWQIVHQCAKCGVEKINKVALDDDQPDDWNKVVLLSCK